jgi:hypothetical protein
VAARPAVRTDLASSNPGSNQTEGMDDCGYLIFTLCSCLSGVTLQGGLSLVQGVLTTVYRITSKSEPPGSLARKSYTDRAGSTYRQCYCLALQVEGCGVVSAAEHPRPLISVL